MTVSVDVPPAAMVAGLNALPTVGAMGLGARLHTDTPLVSRVTAPFSAKARPVMVAPVVRVMLVSAMMLPANAVVVPSVAELPTCQNTLQA